MKWLAMRPAVRSDAVAISDLWTAASEWLRDSGSDQWQYPPNQGKISSDIEDGITFVAVSNFVDMASPVLATITLDSTGDPEFWDPSDRPETALYLRRMITAPVVRGHDVGAALLDWAGGRAVGLGRGEVRLDAWKANKALHAYYRRQRFKQLPTVELAHRRSGARFARPANVRTFRGPHVYDVEHPSTDADGRGAA
ncbi:N-acetyltransferase [Streptomyces sp. SM12]|uniref:GNAT family N-acetyltransferase n=1 Tax=Streptomyces sp. SM12 TaxID=1071602 RepID=UPI0015E1B44A|nr:GNAT family N-acetyltransferase [Streptomyces sp. SM12]